MSKETKESTGGTVQERSGVVQKKVESTFSLSLTWSYDYDAEKKLIALLIPLLPKTYLKIEKKEPIKVEVDDFTMILTYSFAITDKQAETVKENILQRYEELSKLYQDLKFLKSAGLLTELGIDAKGKES